MFPTVSGYLPTPPGANVEIDDDSIVFPELNETIPDAVLRRLLALSPDLMCAAEGDVLVMVNPAWRQTLGWQAGVLPSLSFLELVHPDDLVHARSLVSLAPPAAIVGTPVTRPEFRLRTSDGGYRWISWSARTDGTRWYATGVDVTDARAIAEKARVLASIVEGSDDAIVGKDLNCRIVSWNAGAHRLYGYSEEEALGRPVSMLVPEARRGEETEVLDRVLRGESVRRYETVRVRKDGSIVDVSLTVSPILGVDGRITGVSAVAHDITAEKAADLALQRKEQQLSTILEATAEGVWQVDADNVTLFANSAMAAMLGCSVDELIGATIWDFMAAERIGEAQESMRRRRAGLAERLEFCFTRKDGTDCYTLVSATPLYDADSNYTGALAVVTDLTRGGSAGFREAERFLATVTTVMEEAVLGVDRHGRVVFANARAQAMFDRSDRELHRKEAGQLLEMASGSNALRAAWEGGRAVKDEATIRTDRWSGGVRVSVQAWPQLAGGSVDGAVVILRDTTAEWNEAERRERELNAMVWVGRTKDALDDGRLVLFAQPIIHLKTGRVMSHELLIRMRNTAGELILPGIFLPAAEQHGLISDIDRWVIAQGIEIAASGTAVEINLSAETVGNLAMLRHIERELAAHGADPRLVTFEITETAIMSRTETAARFVRGLRLHGCGVSLDDFGTGFGSFTYLKQLPVTRLKIDRQFVHNLAHDTANQHVVRAIVDLAHGFGQSTVGEGVEDASALALLDAYGVDYAQGYLIGRPVPVSLMVAAPDPGEPFGTPGGLAA
jgi:PAS domain S-box-containing protein